MKKLLSLVFILGCFNQVTNAQSCLFDSQITTPDSVLCNGESTTLTFVALAGSPIDTVLPTPIVNNNGQDGNMFDITATNTIRIKYFEGNIANTPNVTTSYFIYYKVGSHVGFEQNAGAWTLAAGPISFNPNIPNTLTNIPFNLDLTIPAGQTYAFYLTNTSAITNNNRYHNGIATGAISATNADLTVFEGTGGAYPFGTFFNARPWEGIVHYDYPPPTYLWNTGAITNSINVSPLATTDYSCVATFPNCNVEDTITVQVNTPIVTATPASQMVCQNSMTSISGGGAISYAWTGGILNATPFVIVAAANYTVTGTDADGCTGTATAEILMNTLPLVNATATPDVTCETTSVVPNGAGALTYSWTGGLTDNTPFIANTSATYTVTGTDANGCSGTSSISVVVNPATGLLPPVSASDFQQHADDFDLNYYDENCNLICSIDDATGGNILGLTVGAVFYDLIADFHNGQPFVRRWYEIIPTNNGAADVVLCINQSDFDDYNSVAVLPYLPLPTSGNNADPNIGNIRITKNDAGGLGSNPIVITPTANWNGIYWELSFNTPSFSQFRVHGVNPGNVPLAATFANFNGVKLESTDKLSWTTSSEQNNAYFNLQHSSDGTNFTNIAKVNSKAPNGNSDTVLNYSILNPNPVLGHNYYRLQQVDLDNKLSVYAQIVDLIWGTNGSTVSIYPNPATQILNIDLFTARTQNTTVKLLDMSGRMIKETQATSAVGMNNIKMSLDDIVTGIYSIQVYENNKLTHTSKVKKD